MQVFQVAPPIVRDSGNGLELDLDYFGSLKVYLEHFESFALACPVYQADLKGSGLERCIPLAELPWGPDRFKFIPLPRTFNPLTFVRELPRVRRLLRSEVEAAEHLIFSPYSLIGDWPTVAIREAVKLGRRYTIEADVVHGDLMRKRHISDVAWKRWVKRNLLFPAFDASERYCLSHASQGIFQGQDVYRAYAPHCRNAHKLNHHVPVYAGDHITDAQLATKLDGVRGGDPLRIVYAGRAIDMKGPLDWVETLGEAARLGIKFEATWIGDGPLLDAMRDRAAALGIAGVKFAGFTSDRAELLAGLRAAQVFLFCHNTLESARILGEALACGAPLVGFESAYPADLVAEHGGGSFVKVGDVRALALKLRELDRDRKGLADLIASAARSGRDLDRDAALHRRAELVKALQAQAKRGGS